MSLRSFLSFHLHFFGFSSRKKTPLLIGLISIRKKNETKTIHPALLFSWPYALAMSSAVVEYLLESILISPSRWNQYRPPPLSRNVVSFLQAATTATGCLLVAAGELLRKAAMLTATQAFTHDLAFKKEPTHGLVTRGVYSLMRHPGYAGFALWAVGTQLVLRNPVCAVAFAVAVSRFLRARVEAEEALLVGFFGEGYERYAARVKRWWWR